MENLETELDRLYALEPGGFVAERDRLARELRDAGRRAEAQEVKALRRPSLSAWTINRLAREDRRNVDLLLDAGHRLREAQQGLLGGKEAGGLDEARQTERTALTELRKSARRILEDEGRASDSTLNSVMSTLQVAAVSDEGRELLARGRLTGDLEATGFDLLAPATKGRRSPRPRPSGKREQGRKQLEDARKRLTEARAAAKDAAKSLRAAEKDAVKARRELAKIEERVDGGRAAAAKAEQAVKEAEQQVRKAERA